MREPIFDAVVVDGVGYVEYGNELIPFFSNPEYDDSYPDASGWIQVSLYEVDYSNQPYSQEYTNMAEFERDFAAFEPDYEEFVTDILVSIT